MDRRIRVAIIGGGKIATNAHIPAYTSHKHVELVALVDIDEKKVRNTAKKFGINKFYTSVDELFDKEDLDAISVCTPPNTHAEITLKAIENGAHVLCEKPIETDIERAKKMVQSSKRNEKILMVGFNRRFWPNYHLVKKHILEGRLGHVYCVEYQCMQPNPLINWGKSPWFYMHGVGGVILDLGPHVFDMLNFVFGDYPEAIFAQSSTCLDSPVEENCVCILEYPEKRMGVGMFSWLSSTDIEKLSIYGTAQSVFASPTFFLEENSIDIPEVSLWREASRNLIGLKFPNLVHTRKVDTYQLEIDHFIRQINQNRKFSYSALNALNVLITCKAAKESIEKNRRISISAFGGNKKWN